jgi:hypothetical protein
MCEKVESLKIEGTRYELVKGREFTVQRSGASSAGHGEKLRLRFLYAHCSPKGYEVTGWDGQRIRSFRASEVVATHGTTKVPESPETFKPPARRRVR